MEPYVMPLHSSSPPPLDDNSDGEAGSEDDEFGDFGGFSCFPPGFPNSTNPPPSSLQEPPAATRAVKDPTTCNLNRPVELKTLSSYGLNSARGEGFDAELSSHLTNGYIEGGHKFEACDASVVGTFSYMEETGFADFTVFTEQAAHPWCCGLSPLGNPEKCVGEEEGSNSGEQICDPADEVIMESEPRSLCVFEAGKNICTKVSHCEKRDAAFVRPSQDHHQPQEATSALESEQPHFAEEDTGKDGGSGGEIRCNLNSLQTLELQEDEESDKPPTVSVYESAFEDLSSVYEDFSFEGVSSDLEPNVSSLVSPDSQSDWDQTDDDDEELGKYMRSDSLGNSSMTNLSQIEEEKCFHQSVTQETSATSNQSHSLTCRGDEFANFKDTVWEYHRDQESVQDANVKVQSIATLPPSDSFADFCSAPTQEDGEGSWAVFQDQKAQEEGKMWTQVRDQVSSLQTDGCTEEDEDRVQQCGVLRRNSCQVSFFCRVQQLLWATFPEVVVPAVEGEKEAQSLGALCIARQLTQSKDEKMPELSSDQWVQQGLCWSQKDVHSAVGLQFQWAGSHTNRTLLRCLGVDTKNIMQPGIKGNVFTGTKKLVAVPVLASHLEMLDPTKDSAPAACSTGNTAGTPQEFPAPHVKLDTKQNSVQEVLPSSLLECRGLRSSQDDCFALNLDYFGPDEESRSRSSSCSRSSPPPGVDRELYELTMSKLEISSDTCRLEDTWNRLMCAAEKTSTLVRKPLQDEELSAEACRVIVGLPKLSFMKATVLMFPSILIPKESFVSE